MIPIRKIDIRKRRNGRLFWCAPEDARHMTSRRAAKVIARRFVHKIKRDDANRWRLANALAWFELRRDLAPNAVFYDAGQNRAWFWHVIEGGLLAGRKIPIGAVMRGPKQRHQFRKMEARLAEAGYTLHCAPNPKGYTDYWIQPARLARILGGEE